MKFLWSYNYKIKTRGPMVLYRSPECIRYAELEQAWKYMTIFCVSSVVSKEKKFKYVESE